MIDMENFSNNCTRDSTEVSDFQQGIKHCLVFTKVNQQQATESENHNQYPHYLPTRFLLVSANDRNIKSVSGLRNQSYFRNNLFE